MLLLEDIHKRFGDRIILKNVSFHIQPGERAAILGGNGSGKSTLFKIIIGEEMADQGKIRFFPSDLNWFYMPQNRDLSDSDTIDDFLLNQHESIETLQRKLELLSMKMEEMPDNPDLHISYDAVLMELSRASTRQKNPEPLLDLFGLSRFNLQTPIQLLSGGQRTRLFLAAAYQSQARLLLLDEPTNDLDEQMLSWLEKYFCSFSGAILYVSHDRAFINQTATKILELDAINHTIKEYMGNYEDWLAKKKFERESELAAWNRQQTEISQLKDAALRIRSSTKMHRGGKTDSGDKLAAGFFMNRSRKTIKRAVQIENRLNQLMTEDKKEKPVQRWKMKIDFLNPGYSGDMVLSLQNMSVGYDGVPLISDINLDLTRGQTCVLIGPNGCGKTTLLKTITGELQPISGILKLGVNMRIGKIAQILDRSLFQSNALESIQKLSKLNETEVRRFLSYYLFFGDDVYIPSERLSNGQCARLALASFAVQGKNFLVMDEPLNHLDIESREQFGEALLQFQGTVLAVVHDRYFSDQVADIIWEIKDHKILVS
ncbi:ribosomal protection-like ABC-F family protein [Flexilinea flocculi]|uniref:ATPase component of ABC transporter with duplicated ATPase domains n=1 Tax=Flexilinea flocculi TaxID=1678840 RepID=A0A0K8PAY1_9CHLR|nr:ABC-F family ATP-binding cassette domain-containing protein [Flexilinea flocculi]GAP39822.1 ATPase component of ABC transporter with duplicated ATPase domains [Flexilinea flocculi]